MFGLFYYTLDNILKNQKILFKALYTKKKYNL